MIDYFSRPEVSNSDLSALAKYFKPQHVVIDLEAAYRFGTLLDALITEPHRVNLLSGTCDGDQYSRAELELAEEMKGAFMKDEFCRLMVSRSEMQKVSIRPSFPIEHEGHRFRLDVRCKWDLFNGPGAIDGDIKSTIAITQKQFEASIFHFDYHRQAALYMDIEERHRFVIIGISKRNKQVFKVTIKRGDDTYNRGRACYQELAFRYWYLFGDPETYERNPETEMLLEKIQRQEAAPAGVSIWDPSEDHF